MTLSITTLCHYVECRILLIVLPNVVMLSVIMLKVVAPLTSPQSIIINGNEAILKSGLL
jgi:hypothetical protein